MDSNVSEWLNLIFRWIHVLAGVMWIGHLWFFNFVNAQVAKTYTPEGKKQVLPELMPRALYWFRWGAAYTWVTGFLLLYLVYWAGNAMQQGLRDSVEGKGNGITDAGNWLYNNTVGQVLNVANNALSGMTGGPKSTADDFSWKNTVNVLAGPEDQAASVNNSIGVVYFLKVLF